MRTSSTTGILISRGTEEVIATLVENTERWWYLRELARHLGRSASSIEKPLAALVRAGVLRRRRDGNRVYYAPNPESPILPELRGLVRKTVGLVGIVKEALRPFEDRIAVAFVYGSVARGEEAAGSDVDLLVVGSVTTYDLASPLHELDEQLGRSVNASIYTPQEFARRAADRAHFVTSLLGKEKLFVVGSEDALGEIARGETRRRGADDA